MMVCTRMTVIRERREFIQPREKETRRIKFYVQADMYKESIEMEKNTRRYDASLFCIMIKNSTFSEVEVLLVDICIFRHLSCRHSACRRFDVDVLMSTFVSVDIFLVDILIVDIFFVDVLLVDICICRHLHLSASYLSTFCLSTFFFRHCRFRRFACRHFSFDISTPHPSLVALIELYRN